MDKTLKLVGFDIETSDSRGHGALEPRDEGSVVALMQFGFDGDDIRTMRPDEGMPFLRRLLDEDYTFVIHNAFFELDWLLVKYNFPIHKMKVWCTMTASLVLNAGKKKPDKASWYSATRGSKNLDHVGVWEPLIDEDDSNLKAKNPGRFLHNLQATVYRYAGATIEKDQGNSDWLGDLSERQLEYAKDDVRYLNKVARTQQEFIEKLGLWNPINLEMELIPATVQMKQQGIRIDLEQWKKLASQYGDKANALEEELNAALGLELAEREGQVSLFGTVVPKVFKVSSPKYLSEFFGVEKADEATLRLIEHPLIPKLLEYKEAAKIASTYGPNYLKFIRDDGRIHSMLIQTETATSRFSSRSPNLQNVPRDMLKAFLTSDDDKYLVTIDYSSVESRILAYIAEDEKYISTVNSSDVHWENAKLIFHLPPDATREGVFSVSGKDLSGTALRYKAKGVSFG